MNAHLSFSTRLETSSHGMCCTNMVFVRWLVSSDMISVHEYVLVQYVHTLCTLSRGYNVCVYVCCVCLNLCVYVSGRAGFVWPAVWRESLIPCDLVFLQLLSDQNNQLSLPGDPQDGPKPCLLCFFWFSFLGLLLLVTEVVGLVQRITPFREKSGNIEVDSIKVKSSVMDKCCPTLTKR